MASDFIRKHAAASKPLSAWIRRTKAAAWKSIVDLHATFPSADYVEGYVIFNIGGNKYRLTTIVDYAEQQVVVEKLVTHAEYSKGAWKP